MGNKRIFRYVIPTTISLFILYFLFREPTLCATGVKNGLSLCAEVIIPSLFPFIVVSTFLLKSGVIDFLSRPFQKLTKTIFHLPGITAPVILLSMLGGFPIGAKMTAELLKTGQISKTDAQRMHLFCFNAGPAFIIGTVGSGLLGSQKAGVILFASVCIASILTGILSIVLDENTDVSSSLLPKEYQSPALALSSATANAVPAVLTICAWVILFCTVGKILEALPISMGSKLFFSSILEVSTGCKAAAGVLPIPAIAAILSFGGFSVHCQIYGDVKVSHLPFKYFYTARVVTASLSAIICMELLKVFPCEISVFATNTNLTAVAYSISLPACIVLLIMSALLIFEVDTGKKI